MKMVTVKGNTYRSIAAAWRDLSPKGLSLRAVQWRLEEGWYPEEAVLIPRVAPVSRRVFKAVRVNSEEILA